MGVWLGPFGPKEGPNVPCLGAMGIRWYPIGPKWHKSEDVKKQIFKPHKNFDFQYQYQYFDDIDIDFDIDSGFWKFLILILILRVGKFWYWYWFWYWKSFWKNFDIDIDFENQIFENIDIDIEQKFDIVPCLPYSAYLLI